jgi:hypothetical protein
MLQLAMHAGRVPDLTRVHAVLKLESQHGTRGTTMKIDNWAVTVRYAPVPGQRPPTRRHPGPEDFILHTVVGPANAATVEAALDLVDAPEGVRVNIRENDVVRNFVEGKLVPNHPYPHHINGGHYVSKAPGAQFEEWSIAFVFVTRVIADQTTNRTAT